MMLDDRQSNFFQRQMRLACFSISLVLLSACTSTITVEADIPSPLVERLPITAKMSYTDTFREYTYEEAEKGRSLKNMDFSAAQMGMFDKIFGRLLNLVSGDEEKVDLVIEPEILDFQYSAPRETNLKLYEVWLKYRLKLSGAGEKKLADWTIKGYGKTPTASFTSAHTAFNSATNVALRDVGAQLSIRMPNQSVIKGLLDPVEGEEAEEAVVETEQQSVTDGETQISEVDKSLSESAAVTKSADTQSETFNGEE